MIRVRNDFIPEGWIWGEGDQEMVDALNQKYSGYFGYHYSLEEKDVRQPVPWQEESSEDGA